MRFDVLTIFPTFFDGFLAHGIVRRARERRQVDVAVHDLRDWTYDRHRIVDDRPYGGEDGMVLKPEPIFRAVEALTHHQPNPSIVLLTPQGRRFDQAAAYRLSQSSQVVLICGRYEGVDERVAQYLATEELSIGDYVLSGGEPAAMVVMDAVIRLRPDVLGSPTSAQHESFQTGRLDYPVYTRPARYRGHAVPAELLTGNHAEVELWRRRAALRKTLCHRPDLLADPTRLDDTDRRLLTELLHTPPPVTQPVECNL
ncbi:MAG: tRNA (guanosine(37)-N1)-methyltransferase TrmD [Chloracidobacterium sp.]|uniref:tRNA (guanine-N(1)-)-methyltransferase n=1 Tax=Chloracidobacterium validum TaxID=2821543 RepID=A0ABX8BAS6_9BACT|nr:tRNA (guanosine(37)-N1)-methyltransferase TrmD [Chloracidobacterium validum]QUW03978.1 tRNA (guanosine(37)-N1)-methyltransferase TrmD [Chloracidobacterium validum]